MKKWLNSLSFQTLNKIGFSILFIGIILLIIGIIIDSLALIIISVLMLIPALMFIIIADKKKKGNKNNTNLSVYSGVSGNINKNFSFNTSLSTKQENNQNKTIVPTTESQDRVKYKNLISNNFDLESIKSTFQCSLKIMALKQIKENTNFNSNDLPFDVDERIKEIKELSKSIFLKSNYRSFCALDLETTGLSAEQDRVIQIAIVKVINGEIVDNFSTYVNPKRHIKQAASEINNIYDEDVKEAKTIKEIFPEILNYIGKLPVVAHNADFDLEFLRQEYLRNFKTEMPKLKYKCSMKLWQRQYLQIQGEKVPSAKLSTLVINLLSDEEIKDYLNNQHDACCDAVATAKVFMKIYGEIKTKE